MLRKSKKLTLPAFLLFFFIGSILFTIQCAQKEKVPPPPSTRVIPVAETLHGLEITDPYRWLEEQESSETREWIEVQNNYTDSLIKKLPGREELKGLLEKLIKIDTVGVPNEVAGRYFFFKRKADQDLSVLYLREGRDGEDQVLVDPHPLSEDRTVSINLQEISRDGKLLAYGIRRGGEDEVEIRLFDVDNRKDLPDSLPRARYFGLSLTPDKSSYYYVRHTSEGPRVFFHKIGTDPAADKEIFGEGYGPEMILSAELSDNGRWLLVTVFYGAAADKTELFLKDLSKKDAPFCAAVKDIDARFYGEIAGNMLFVETNWQAPNGRLIAIDPEKPAQENWREVVPESDSVLQGFSACGGNLFLRYLKNVQSNVRMYDVNGTFIRGISFPTIGTVSGVNGRWDSDEAFFVFNSFHIPTTIYRHEVSTGKQEVWAKIEVPIESEKYEVKQVWYTSKDGTRVPMFIVHAKELKLGGQNPTLLTGYGGFNASLTPGFSAQAAAWLERGGVYALTNLRGGGEFGEKWHQAGMRENKQNVFDDFIAAADYLIKNKYTNPKKLAITGGSNGGLLVGAAMTQRPELFAAVVCTYPLLDMVRYHKFLVARYWVPEYGSADDPAQFKYLYAYSPYHNVKKGTKYPAVLFITGDADTRVAPLHARKMAALMQASTESGKPVLLRYHVKAGHSGGMPVSQQIEDLTDTLSFLFWQIK